MLFISVKKWLLLVVQANLEVYKLEKVLLLVYAYFFIHFLFLMDYLFSFLFLYIKNRKIFDSADFQMQKQKKEHPGTGEKPAGAK